MGLPFLTPDDKPPCAVDPDAFFSDDRGIRNAAKRECFQCPFVVECREWSIVHELEGVWGGTDRDERKQIRRELGITLSTPQIHKSSGDWVTSERRAIDKRSRKALFERDYRALRGKDSMIALNAERARKAVGW